jgi:hypothetical protein
LIAAKRRRISAQGERSATLGHQHSDVSPEGAKEHSWNSQLLGTFFLRPFRACPHWGPTQVLRRFAALITLRHFSRLLKRADAEVRPYRHRFGYSVHLLLGEKANLDKPAACRAQFATGMPRAQQTSKGKPIPPPHPHPAAGYHAFMQACPLCEQASSRLAKDRLRAYYHCLRCDLIFAALPSRQDPAAEKARYDRHQNDPADPRYRSFLNRLAQPLLARLKPAQHGLDYGCGPAPALSLMLEEAGMVMALYDPYYAPDRQVLERRYDFVTCTEVVEHFRSPAEEWARLAALVKPGGWLAIMTRLVVDRKNFSRWRYKDDFTHVRFYSAATMNWLAARLGLAVDQREDGVVLFQKPAVNLEFDAQRAVDSSGVAETRFVTKT